MFVAKQGISKRFLSYFHSLDTSIGARALGPDQTISGKVQSTVNAATQQAKSVDEQKGFTKTANDVRISGVIRLDAGQLTYTRSTMPKPLPRLWDRKFALSIPRRVSKSRIFMRRLGASPKNRRRRIPAVKSRVRQLLQGPVRRLTQLLKPPHMLFNSFVREFGECIRTSLDTLCYSGHRSDSLVIQLLTCY